MTQQKLKIKVCGLKEDTNIKKVSSLSPNFLGFIHYPKSKRYVGSNFKLPQTLPENQKKVAVLVNESLDSAINIFNQGYDFLQLHGNESVSYCESLAKENIPLFKAFGIHSSFNFNNIQKYEPYIKTFIFDTSTTLYGGSGKKFDWTILQEYTLKTPFLLSGGITKNDLQTIHDFQHPQLIGVDINSGFELSPGIKNIEDLGYFFFNI